jgi:hypothetical protein
MKKLLLTLLSAGILSLGVVTLSAQEEKKKGKKKDAAMAQTSETAPKSVIHVVTVAFKK